MSEQLACAVFRCSIALPGSIEWIVACTAFDDVFKDL